MTELAELAFVPSSERVAHISWRLLWWPTCLLQGQDVSSFNGVLNIAGALYSSVLFLGILDCEF